MASVPSEIEAPPVAAPGATVLIMLSSASHEALERILGNLSLAFVGGDVLVLTSEMAEASVIEFGRRYPNVHLVTDASAVPSAGGWVLTASDFVDVYKTAQQHGAGGCLLLGQESESLSVDALHGLATAVSNGADLVVPRYETGPTEGLVNSALLYPVSRAIFGAKPRFPLAIDLGLSSRMASRLATVAQKFTAMGQNDALVWPVAEAAVAGYSVVEVAAGVRKLPHPAVEDLNALLGHIAASLFTEVETHASFWQRMRVSTPGLRAGAQVQAAKDTFPDVGPMIESFQLAYRNLHEIWSLVLPPNSLLGLKRLSQMPAAGFRMSDSLWARTVYDFILAYRLRTINRGHLLGALTPLYLAWVASHLLLVRSGTDPERRVEEVALAFEADKPYLVSRWRWPDRFNP